MNNKRKKTEMHSTILFEFRTVERAIQFKMLLDEDEIICETRGDYVEEIVDNDGFYVVIHTRNITGMVDDLKEFGYLS